MSEKLPKSNIDDHFDDKDDGDDKLRDHGLDQAKIERIKQATPEEMSEALDLAEYEHAEIIEMIVKSRDKGLKFTKESIEDFASDALGAKFAKILLKKWLADGSDSSRTLNGFKEFIQAELDRNDDILESTGVVSGDAGLWHAADYVLYGYLDLAISNMLDNKDKGINSDETNPEYGYDSEHFNEITSKFI